MARLGEQLVTAGIVSAELVDTALRAQVVWGGRLGTNLIELGAIDLDELSRSLGQQHGVAAAAARHFDKADPELQALLPAEVAKRYSIVPLVRLSPDRIAIVALDPLSDEARDALAEIYGVDPMDGIVTSVAAEMRVLYHLERVYKLARPTRFLRTKGGANVTAFPTFDLSFELDVEVEPEIVDELAPIEVEIDVETDAAPAPMPGRRTTGSMPPISVDDIALLLDQAIETAPDPEQAGPLGRERRTYLRTLADDVAPAPPVPRPVVPPLPRPPPRSISIPPLKPPIVDAPTVSAPLATAEALRGTFDAPTVSAPLATAEALRASVEPPPVVPSTSTGSTTGQITGALGRIAIRRVALSTPPPNERLLTPTSFVESTRAIKRGPNRDRVAELVIETLDRYVPTCAAALLLVIRGDVAIGWKHFSRADDGTSEVAVPLDQDGIVPTVISRRTPTRCAAADLGAIDGLLLRAVGNGTDGELAVVPIAIGDQVMCVLAAATSAEAELAPFETIASAAAAAFARLIRDASR